MNEAFTRVFSKYINFADIFLLKLAVELLKYININNYAIKLINNSQLLYGLNYSLRLIELEILKAYIKNNLVNMFIRLFKFLAKTPIFFNKKPNKSLRLCIDYQGINYLIIKTGIFYL